MDFVNSTTAVWNWQRNQDPAASKTSDTASSPVPDQDCFPYFVPRFNHNGLEQQIMPETVSSHSRCPMPSANYKAIQASPRPVGTADLLTK